MSRRTEDSYDKNVGRARVQVMIKYVVRRLVKSTGQCLKSTRIKVDSTTSYVELPGDYVDWSRIGVVNSNGEIEVLSENDDLSIASTFLTDVNGATLTNVDGIPLTGSPEVSSSTPIGQNNYPFYISGYQPGTFMYGKKTDVDPNGFFRINDEWNRIEIGSLLNSDLVLEYSSDPTMSTGDFTVSVHLEEAVYGWAYYHFIKGKRGVPQAEVHRARSEAYHEMERSDALLRPINVAQMMKAWRHSNVQSPRG